MIKFNIFIKIVALKYFTVVSNGLNVCLVDLVFFNETYFKLLVDNVPLIIM